MRILFQWVNIKLCHYRREQVHYTTTPMDGQLFGMRNTIVIDGNGPGWQPAV